MRDLAMDLRDLRWIRRRIESATTALRDDERGDVNGPG